MAKVSEELDRVEKDSEKKPKKSFNKRRFKYGSIATAITVVVIAVVVLVNVVLNIASDKVNMSVDLTENGTFEISQETKDYLGTVNEPVDIVCLSDENTFKTSNYVYYKQAYEVLKKYTIYSDNVTLKFVDTVKDPTYVERYSQSYKGEIGAYNIVVESSKRIKVISIQDLYNTEINYTTFSQEVVSSNAEQELTSAIMYVTDPDPLKVVMFNSPTSATSYQNIMDLFTSNGYDVSEIDPLSEAIPEDTDIVAVVAPLNDYDENVIDSLYKFLDNGGALGKSLVYFADYSQKSTANIDAFIQEWGIKVGEGVVGEDDAANLQTQSFYIIRDYIKENDFSGNVAQMDLPVIDYQSRPLELVFDKKETRSALPLLQTSETGFVLTKEMQKQLESGEKPEIPHGVQTTMAIGRNYVFNSENQAVYSNVLVIGSAETLDNQLTSTTYFNNGDYFISVLNTMTGKNTGISIVAKDLKSPTFDIDQQKIRSYFVVFVILVPVAVLIFGIAVFIKRRTK